MQGVTAPILEATVILRLSTGPKEEPTEKDIQDQIKATLARLSGAGKSGKFAQRAKFRRQKRDDVAAKCRRAWQWSRKPCNRR